MQSSFRGNKIQNSQFSIQSKTLKKEKRPVQQMREQIIKLTGIFFAILIILALILFITSRISATIFWIVVIISAIVAYKVLPRLRNK